MWRIWVDTGGTFTDGLALDPEGRLHRAKVLSSSALRGRLEAVAGERAFTFRAPWRLPDDFAAGAELRWRSREDAGVRVVSSRAGGRLALAAPLPKRLAPGEPFELRFAEEAPVLAARLLTATPAGQALPDMAMRLATTRGTNALLERRGARCVLMITRGFADLLEIGDQRRDDLFALDVRKPPPLYARVIEVPERLDADGRVTYELDLAALRPRLSRLAGDGIESAAVALLHSYRNSEHERLVARELEGCGIHHVAASAELAPVIKIVPRAQTAVVDAYLAPIVDRYLGRVASALPDQGRLHVMTSAGGLVAADRYRAKDSLLSGPAGGVVGADGLGTEDTRRAVTAAHGDGRPGEETAAAHRRHHDVELGHVLEELERRRALSGDDVGMVVGRDQRAAGACQHLRRGRLPRRLVRLALDDVAAVLIHRAPLHGVGVPRHDDVRRDAAHARRQRQRLGVVARAVGHDARRRHLVGELEQRVGRAAELERTDLLQVLTFEEQRTSRHLIDRPTRDDRRTASCSVDAGGGFADAVQIGSVLCHRPIPPTLRLPGRRHTGSIGVADDCPYHRLRRLTGQPIVGGLPGLSTNVAGPVPALLRRSADG